MKKHCMDALLAEHDAAKRWIQCRALVSCSNKLSAMEYVDAVDALMAASAASDDAVRKYRDHAESK